MVAQILDRIADMAIELQVAGLEIGLLVAQRRIDLVATDGEALAVDAEAVREAQEAAVAQRRAADDVRGPPRKTGAGREDADPGRS